MIRKALELWEWCRKTVQIKLFNVSVVVRVAQIKCKEGSRVVKSEGVLRTF